MRQEWDRDYESLAIKDADDPKSLVNITPLWLSNAIKAIPDELFLMGEEDLRINAKFDEYEDLLRISFWEEYRRCMRMDCKIVLANVYGGICSKNRFDISMKNSYKLAFIITPPREVSIALESLMYLGIDQMRIILEASNYDKRGNLDAKLAMVKMRIFQDITNRRRGLMLQKSEVVSKNLNVNVDTTNKEPAKSLEQLEREIHELTKMQLTERQETIDIAHQMISEVVGLDE